MIEALTDAIREGKPFYRRSAVYDIFSWKELESLLNYRPAINTNRFRSPVTDIRWPVRTWMSDPDTFPPEILEDIIKNNHFHITDSSRVNSKLNGLCAELEDALGLPTDAHIYVDLRDLPGEGFGTHFDYSHNLIVQVEGTTEFTMWNEIAEQNSSRKSDDIATEPLFRIILEPGDVVYAPAYYYHKAVSLTKRLSVSFPSTTFPAPTGSQERHWISLDIP